MDAQLDLRLLRYDILWLGLLVANHRERGGSNQAPQHWFANDDSVDAGRDHNGADSRPYRPRRGRPADTDLAGTGFGTWLEPQPPQCIQLAGSHCAVVARYGRTDGFTASVLEPTDSDVPWNFLRRCDRHDQFTWQCARLPVSLSGCLDQAEDWDFRIAHVYVCCSDGAGGAGTLDAEHHSRPLTLVPEWTSKNWDAVGIIRGMYPKLGVSLIKKRLRIVGQLRISG